MPYTHTAPPEKWQNRAPAMRFYPVARGALDKSQRGAKGTRGTVAAFMVATAHQWAQNGQIGRKKPTNETPPNVTGWARIGQRLNEGLQRQQSAIIERMATPENKCPLCEKTNLATEWACVACGAKLPLAGDRAIGQAPYKVPERVVEARTQRKPMTKQQWVIQFVMFCLLILLPFKCALTARDAREAREKRQIATVQPSQSTAPQVSSRPVIPQQAAPQAAPQANATGGRFPFGSISSTDAAARGLVWVNTNTMVFHRPSGRWYATTNEGYFTSAAEALAAGARESLR